MNKYLSIIMVLVLMSAVFAIAEQNRQDEASSPPAEYASFTDVTENNTLSGEFTSIAADENTVHVISGTADIVNAKLSRISANSTGGVPAASYGVGACILITGGTANITDSVIDTEAIGGTGVFTHGSGTASVCASTIVTSESYSDGIRVSGGGTLSASDLTVTTNGAFSSAIGSGQDGGIIVIDNGHFTSNGTDSPVITAEADITANNAILTANRSEAVRIQGSSIVRLNNSVLADNITDTHSEENEYTVLITGESEPGSGIFEMNEGTVSTQSSSLFRIIGTEAVVTMKNVSVLTSNSWKSFLNCTAANERKSAGSNCIFTAIAQRIDGDFVRDSYSSMQISLTLGSSFTGTVVLSDQEAELQGDADCDLYIDDSSVWVVTDSCTVRKLACAGIITDSTGSSVTIRGTDGNTYTEGNGSCIITVSEYSTTCDLTASNAIDTY